MTTPAPKANWFYPALVWITAVPAGSLLFTLFTALIVKNHTTGFSELYNTFVYILFGALIISFFSMGVSYLAFAITVATKMKPSPSRLITIVPHVLVILYVGISFLRTDKDNALSTGLAYILLYFIPVVVFASAFRPHRKA